MREKLNNTSAVHASCPMPGPDFSKVEQLYLTPATQVADYLQAMDMAKKEAAKRYEDFMLMSWYDRDRDYESPQHATECEGQHCTPGYIDYALKRDARLRVDIENGRFVFFFTPVDW